MPDASTVEIQGYAQFRAELRVLGKEWPRALTRTNKAMAAPIASAAQSRARGLGGVQAKAAGAIKAYASTTALGIGVPRKSGRYPFAGAAFWGSNEHSGWYNAPEYAGGKAQHPPWVGNTWDAGVHGQGPYAINDAVADHADKWVERWAKEIDVLAARAFPNK